MDKHLYPWWMGYLLLSPFRYLTQNPTKLLSPYVSRGMKVLDVGCGPGFFSLPLARLVGQSGRVYCADLQPKMIAILESRAKRAGLDGRIKTSVCKRGSLALDELGPELDFALAYGVVHEVPDRVRFFAELGELMKPGASLLVVEPKHVVKDGELDRTLAIAESGAFDLGARVATRRRHGARLIRRSP